MKELLELKEKTEKEIADLYQILSNPDFNQNTINNTVSLNKRLSDKIDFLKLIEIIYHLK